MSTAGPDIPHRAASPGADRPFLEAVYDLLAQGRDEEAIDAVFEHVDRLLEEVRYEDCERMLVEVDLDRIPVVLMLALLTITSAAGDRIRNRPAFFAEIRRRIERDRGEAKAKRLLDGLE